MFDALRIITKGYDNGTKALTFKQRFINSMTQLKELVKKSPHYASPESVSWVDSSGNTAAVLEDEYSDSFRISNGSLNGTVRQYDDLINGLRFGASSNYSETPGIDLAYLTSTSPKKLYKEWDSSNTWGTIRPSQTIFPYQEDVIIDYGKGADSVRLSSGDDEVYEANFSQAVQIKLGKGKDNFSYYIDTNDRFTGECFVDLGKGNDRVENYSRKMLRIRVSLGKGKDKVIHGANMTITDYNPKQDILEVDKWDEFGRITLRVENGNTIFSHGLILEGFTDITAMPGYENFVALP